LTVLKAGVVWFTIPTVTSVTPFHCDLFSDTRMIGETACTGADNTLQRATEK